MADAACVTQLTSSSPGEQGLNDSGADIDSGDYGSEVLLLRVMSDIRRAYCRQPLSGISVDGVSGSLSTEFVKQLSEYSDTSLHQTTPHMTSSPTAFSCPGHLSQSTTSGDFGKQLTTGRVGSTDHVTPNDRGGMRPRRTVSLDRQVSLLPFLRPIEEEETSTRSRLTPTHPWSGIASTSSSSLSTSSDEEQPLTVNGIGQVSNSQAAVSGSSSRERAGKKSKRRDPAEQTTRLGHDDTCMDSDDDCIFKGKVGNAANRNRFSQLVGCRRDDSPVHCHQLGARCFTSRGHLASELSPSHERRNTTTSSPNNADGTSQRTFQKTVSISKFEKAHCV